MELYSNPQVEGFVETARLYDVDYVLVMAGLALPDLELVYENDLYIVYRVPRAIALGRRG